MYVNILLGTVLANPIMAKWKPTNEIDLTAG